MANRSTPVAGQVKEITVDISPFMDRIDSYLDTLCKHTKSQMMDRFREMLFAFKGKHKETLKSLKEKGESEKAEMRQDVETLSVELGSMEPRLKRKENTAAQMRRYLDISKHRTTERFPQEESNLQNQKLRIKALMSTLAVTYYSQVYTKKMWKVWKSRYLGKTKVRYTCAIKACNSCKQKLRTEILTAQQSLENTRQQSRLEENKERDIKRKYQKMLLRGLRVLNSDTLLDAIPLGEEIALSEKHKMKSSLKKEQALFFEGKKMALRSEEKPSPEETEKIPLAGESVEKLFSVETSFFDRSQEMPMYQTGSLHSSTVRDIPALQQNKAHSAAVQGGLNQRRSIYIRESASLISPSNSSAVDAEPSPNLNQVSRKADIPQAGACKTTTIPLMPLVNVDSYDKVAHENKRKIIITVDDHDKDESPSHNNGHDDVTRTPT